MDNQSAGSEQSMRMPAMDQRMDSQIESGSYPWSAPTTEHYSSSSSAEASSYTSAFNSGEGLEKEVGWDLEFVPQRSEKYDCPICLLVLREPMQTQCGHRFCRACILKWLRESECRCPVDNQQLEEKHLFPDNFAKREILALSVKCPNHAVGCDQIVVLKHLQSHLRDCKYSIILCPNGCRSELLRGQLSEHLVNSCSKRRMVCSQCKKEIVADKEQEHMKDCPLSTISCPNCEESLVRERLPYHINTDCPKTTVTCQYQFIGCSHEGERESMTAHENEQTVYHMTLINQSLIRLWVLLQQQPPRSQARHPSSLGIHPSESNQQQQGAAGTGSGAASYPSYFVNALNNPRPAAQITLLQDICQQLNVSVDSVSLSPAHSVTTSYVSPAPMAHNLLTATATPMEGEPCSNMGSASHTQYVANNTEQRNNSNQTCMDILSYTSKPSNRLDNEVPQFCSANTQQFGSTTAQQFGSTNTQHFGSTNGQLLSMISQNDIQDESLARHDSQLIDLAHKCDYHEKLIREMKSRIKSLESTVQDFEGRNSNGVFVWKIKNYTKLRCDAERGESTAIHSGPFYSSFHGYKLCIRVNLNGVDSAKGTHLSLFIHFMQGEFDDLLEWPFNGRIVLTVIDQNPVCEMRRNISETLMSKPNLAAFQRPASTRNHKGFGYMEFLPLNIIHGSTYIRNDCLIIKASVVSSSP